MMLSKRLGVSFVWDFWRMSFERCDRSEGSWKAETVEWILHIGPLIFIKNRPSGAGGEDE